MSVVDEKKFLNCFEQLTEFDDIKRDKSINYILNEIKHGFDYTKDTPISQTNGLLKSPLAINRSYKHNFTLKENALLQYSVDRLIKGLKSRRKNSALNFTHALTSLLNEYCNYLKNTEVVSAIIYHTNIKDCLQSEVKDVLCGRLFGFYALQRAGYFTRKECLDNLDLLISSIWEVYDQKTYFQDAVCICLYLISRDLYTIDNSVELSLKYVKDRLSILTDAPEGDDRLSCPIFGLYIRLFIFFQGDDLSVENSGNPLKSPLSPEMFSLTLRHVSSLRHYKGVGSFFYPLLDLINSMEIKYLERLWNSINLTMFEGSVHVIATGLKLSVIIFKKITSSEQLRLLFRNGTNYFKTLLRYYKASKGHPLKNIVTESLKLLSALFLREDADVSKLLFSNEELVPKNIDTLIVSESCRLNSAVVLLEKDCRMNCINMLGEICYYSPSNSAVFQKLLDSILRVENILEMYEGIKEQLRSLCICGDSAKIYWIFNLLHSCVNLAHKSLKMQIVKDYASLLILCISTESTENSSNSRDITINSAKINDLTVIFATHSDSLVDLDELRGKVLALSKYLLNSFVTLFSRAMDSTCSKQPNVKDNAQGILAELVKHSFSNIERIVKLDVTFSIEANGELLPSTAENTKSIRIKPRGVNENDLSILSKKLFDKCEKLKSDSPLLLCGFMLSLLLKVLGYCDYHLKTLSLGLVPDGSIVSDNIDVIVELANTLLTAPGTKILTNLASNTLRQSIVTQDSSPITGLFHTICKEIWKHACIYINDKNLEIIVKASLFDDTEEWEDVELDGESGDEEEEDDDDEEEEEECVEEDSASSSDDEHLSSEGESLEVTPVPVGDGSDILVTSLSEMEDLLLSVEGEEKLRKMRDQRQRSKGLLSMESIKLKLSHLDLLQTYISSDGISFDHLIMLNRLFNGFCKCSSLKANEGITNSIKSVLEDYSNKIFKVINIITTDVKFKTPVETPYLTPRSHTSDKEDDSDMIGITQLAEGDIKEPKANAATPSSYPTGRVITNILSDVLDALSRIRGVPRLYDLSLDIFRHIYDLEYSSYKGQIISTTSVIQAGLLNIVRNKNSKLGTKFFLLLSKRVPGIFNFINLIAIASESRIDFIQSEIITIANNVNNSKLFQGELKDTLEYNTSNILYQEYLNRKPTIESTAHDLLGLLDKLKTKITTETKDKGVSQHAEDSVSHGSAVDDTVENNNITDGTKEEASGNQDTNITSKRSRTERYLSSQLVKSIALLVNTVSKSLLVAGEPDLVSSIRESIRELVGLMESSNQKDKRGLNALNTSLNLIKKSLK